MDLTLILGPMKSGKSFDLISHFAPLEYTDIPFGLFQSTRHVRDAAIRSRTGVGLAAERLSSLAPILDRRLQIVGIDEVHMFPADEAEIVAALLRRGVRVIASGLDMDYRGLLMPTVQRLLELGPDRVRYRKAVCEVCRRPNATHTQVYCDGEPLVEGLPPVLPEDGRYVYRPVCRDCFVQKALGFVFDDPPANPDQPVLPSAADLRSPPTAAPLTAAAMRDENQSGRLL